MNILLDTHLILWFALGDERFPLRLRPLVEDCANGIFASEVSLLEITIKHARNAQAMPYTGVDFIELCNQGSIELRPLTREAILSYASLDLERVGDLHKDPFDRLLIAQAKSEGLIFATHDRLLALYGEKLVDVYT